MDWFPLQLERLSIRFLMKQGQLVLSVYLLPWISSIAGQSRTGSFVPISTMYFVAVVAIDCQLLHQQMEATRHEPDLAYPK